MRTLTLPLLCAALSTLAHASEVAAARPEAEAASPATAPLQVGDAASSALLPEIWIRGERVKAFEPGVTYLIALWNTSGSHSYAPGYNIERAMRRYRGDSRIKPVVVLLMDESSPEKLSARLARPSQQTPFPIAHATAGSPSEALYARLFNPADAGKRDRKTGLIVRDGRIIWTGDVSDLTHHTLTPLLAPDFNLETHAKNQAERGKRTRELIKLLMNELPEAEKAKDDARVQSILRTVESEPDLERFVYTRLRDTKCGMAMEKGDLAGAVAEMRLLSDKYPDDAGTQSWVHKVVAGTEELYKPGLDLCAVASERMTRIPEVDNASAWWQMVAKYRLELGDKKAALAALENALKTGAPYKRLEAMKKAAN